MQNIVFETKPEARVFKINDKEVKGITRLVIESDPSKLESNKNGGEEQWRPSVKLQIFELKTNKNQDGIPEFYVRTFKASQLLLTGEFEE